MYNPFQNRFTYLARSGCVLYVSLFLLAAIQLALTYVTGETQAIFRNVSVTVKTQDPMQLRLLWCFANTVVLSRRFNSKFFSPNFPAISFKRI